MTELVPTKTDLTKATESEIIAIRSQVAATRARLNDLTFDELHGTIIWAEAVAAAGKAKRAWEIAREASELQLRAQRALGEFLNSGPGHDEQMRVAFGLQSPGRPREVNPDLADEIGELHQEGLSFSEIARRLNERGTKSPNGGSWYPSGIRRIALWGKSHSLLDPKEEGAYTTLARMPEDLFESVAADLLERGKSVDPRTVIRIGRQQSLEHIEPGIFRSWDGLFFTRSAGRSSYGGYRRSSKKTLEEVREELYEEERLTKKTPRTGPSKLLDEAFAEARRDAQALNQLGESGSFYPEVRDLIGQAELLQAKVASVLYEAYRQFKIQEKERRPMKIPR